MVKKSEFLYQDNAVFDVLHKMKLIDLLNFKEGGQLDICTSQVWDIKPCQVCGSASDVIVVEVSAKTVRSVSIQLKYFCRECYDGC